SRPTQAAALDGTIDYPLHLGMNSTAGDSLTLEFDELTLTIGEAREPASLRHLLAYEGFDYAAGDLAGQNGGTGWAEPWSPSVESRRTDWPMAEVSAPGQTFGDLATAGNKALLT